MRIQPTQVLQQVHRHFFEADLAARTFSRVDEYFRTLERTVDEQVGKIAQNKSKKTEAETKRLKQVTRLDDREREDRSRKPSSN